MIYLKINHMCNISVHRTKTISKKCYNYIYNKSAKPNWVNYKICSKTTKAEIESQNQREMNTITFYFNLERK